MAVVDRRGAVSWSSRMTLNDFAALAVEEITLDSDDLRLRGRFSHLRGAHIGSQGTTMKRSRRQARLGVALGATAGLLGVLLSVAACGGHSSSPTSPSLPSAPAIVYLPGNGVSSPTLVREVKPIYPAEAIAAGIQGTVLLTAVVLADGAVGEVTIVRSLDTVYGLDAQAVSAVKQWVFNPGQKDGAAVAVRVAVEVIFTLRE